MADQQSLWARIVEVARFRPDQELAKLNEREHSRFVWRNIWYIWLVAGPTFAAVYYIDNVGTGLPQQIEDTLRLCAGWAFYVGTTAALTIFYYKFLRFQIELEKRSRDAAR